MGFTLAKCKICPEMSQTRRCIAENLYNFVTSSDMQQLHTCYISVVFTWRLIVTWVCISLPNFPLKLVKKKESTPLSKPIKTMENVNQSQLPTFGFTLNSHWLFKVFLFLLIGHCDYFGFGFTTLIRRAFSREGNLKQIKHKQTPFFPQQLGWHCMTFSGPDRDCF